MKICSKCKAEKPKIEFSKDKTKKDGLQTKCRICNAAAVASHRAANLDWDKARKAASHLKNRDENNRRRSIYRSENLHKENAYHAAYRQANPEKVSANWRNRRARKRNSEGTNTAADIKTIFTNQRGLCANCQIKLFKSGKNKYHVDHIMPLVLGGSNWPANLQCLCPSCNLSKGAKHPDEWAKLNGKLL